MGMSKKRQAIWDKSNGHCIYCGVELGDKGWHADHVIPIIRNTDGTCQRPELDCFENLYPSCASCNKLKSSGDIECLRGLIYRFVDSLNKYHNQYKFAKRYGQVQETRHPIVFYFEKVGLDIKTK